MSTTETRLSPPSAGPEPRKAKGKSWIDHWEPEDPEFWESHRQADRQAQPDLVDLRRAPRLLGLAAVERQRGAAGQGRLRLHPAAAVLAGRRAEPGRLAAAAALHLRGAEVRRPQLDDRQRAAAGDPDAAVRRTSCSGRTRRTGCSCVIAATAGFGGGNFASSMANINFFYPTRQEGRGARPQRGRRQHRRRAHPVLPADHRRRRGRVRSGQGQPERHRPGAGRLPVRRAGRRRRGLRRTSS